MGGVAGRPRSSAPRHGRRRDRVPHADSALERRKEPVSVCEVPESLLSSFFPLHPGSKASFPPSLPFPAPAFSSHLLFSFPLSAFLSFSCSSYLSVPGGLLLPSSSLLPLLLSLFYPFRFFSLCLTFATLLLPVLCLCSPWASGCPSAAVWGHPERADGTQLNAPHYRPHSLRVRGGGGVGGHRAYRRAGWDGALTLCVVRS